MDDTEESDRGNGLRVAASVLRVLALAMHVVVLTMAVYWLLGKDVYWGGMPWADLSPLTTANLTYVLLALSAVQLLIGWGKNLIWRLSFWLVAIVHVVSLLFWGWLFCLFLAHESLAFVLASGLSLLILIRDWSVYRGGTQVAGPRLSRIAKAVIGGITLSYLALATVLWSNQKAEASFPGLEGSIVCLDSDMYRREFFAYNPATGIASKTPIDCGADHPLEIMCLGPESTLILSERAKRSACYSYEPFTADATTIKELSEPAMTCYSLEYHDPTGEYLVDCWYADRAAYLLLDSSFQILEDYPSGMQSSYRGPKGVSCPSALIDSAHSLVCRRSAISRLNHADSTEVQLCRGELMALSPNNRWILVVSQDGQYALVNTLDGRARQLSLRGLEVDGAAFSPDSRDLALNTGRFGVFFQGNRLYLYDIETGELHKTSCTERMHDIHWIPQRKEQ